MNQLTCIVENPPHSKQLGIPPYYYRYRSCQSTFPNRTQSSVLGTTPANQYQNQKIMQHTVRIDTSLYLANKAPLAGYERPIAKPDDGLYGVCWNQMSDRAVPSVQRATIPTGQYSATNRRHTSVTSSKPGSQTPGGKGCDIKHNSYDRYLNRLKGKGPLRRGVIPPHFGKPVLFNPAFPIYGGKTTKTNIISNCACEPTTRELEGSSFFASYPAASHFVRKPVTDPCNPCETTHYVDVKQISQDGITALNCVLDVNQLMNV